MSSDPAGVTHRVTLPLVAILLLASVASAGPIPLDRSLGSVDQTISETTTTRLVVEGHDVGYEGRDVASVTVHVNNDGSELVGDIRVVLTAKNGTVLVSETKTGVVLAPGHSSVTVDLTGTYDVKKVTRIHITAGASL